MRTVLLGGRAANVAPSSPWPLSPSSNQRYIVDGEGNPFFILGDSSQSVASSLSLADLNTFFTTRRLQGVNALWAHLWQDYSPSLFGSPWVTGVDVAQPRPSYWAHIDDFLNVAKDNGVVVFFGISGLCSNISKKLTQGNTAWLANGATKLYNHGKYIGDRWKNQGNIVWTIGNDWTTWTPADDPDNVKVLELARGIREGDAGAHMITVETYPTPTKSTDATSWRSKIGINASYSYLPMYGIAKEGYQYSPTTPNVLFETIYEDDGTSLASGHGYVGTPRILRSAAYWSILYGATCGYFYGHNSLWRMVHADLAIMDTVPQQQLIHIRNLFTPRRWYDLVPDFSHTIGTAGLGAFPAGSGFVYDVVPATATTVAATADGTLCIAYMERNRALTINCNQLEAGRSWKWFNPETGAITAIPGTFSGSHVFTPTARTGDDDWVLIGE